MQVRYSPYDFDVHEGPYPYYARLHDQAPVFRNETDDFWTLSRHADVRAALRNSDGFSSRNGFRMEPAFWGPRAESVIADLPAHHDRTDRAPNNRGFASLPTRVTPR
ncbi:hypothetical protein [Nocardia sp. NPDC004604]|uniref:hypothetical protein n=1 Tax=Nocardia sp. NPDC004604 TaxID=3157013 RepID=UPI0033ABCA45